MADKIRRSSYNPGKDLHDHDKPKDGDDDEHGQDVTHIRTIATAKIQSHRAGSLI